MEKATKKYRTQSIIFKGLGYASLLIGTVGGFFVYQVVTDWSQFQTELENFVVINQDTVKLNMVVAIPILLSIIIFTWIVMRKNREFFKDKISLGLFMMIAILYLIYSLIELTLATLTGAFLGAIIDEFIFNPIASHYSRLYVDNKEIDVEYDKELRRVKARQKVKVDTDGSV
jgi:hypothetical protein